ncbi:MAG: helix-turn-helix domain-containing protein [Lachnospiraceae bacterium]|nr:helix-turn-helix domain-containing protein [Lachnospiraceae bacterium]
MATGKYKVWLDPDGLTLIEAWARNGLTDEEIAKKMGITRSTLYEWKKKYPDISDALKKGKEIVDIQVENALLKRALGYEYEEISEEYGVDGNLVKRKVTVKQVVPDTTAQIYWLKNRNPEQWRDKPVSSKEDTIIENITALTDVLMNSRPDRNLTDYE